MALIIQYFALGIHNLGAKKAYGTPELRTLIQELVTSEMNREREQMCKTSTGCVLKNTQHDKLTNFELAVFNDEFTKMAPVTANVLASLCKPKRSKKETVDHNVVATIASTILRCRCPDMSAVAYRIGILLRHYGTGTQACTNPSIRLYKKP